MIEDTDDVTTYFVIENSRTFEEDPRFGLIALSEIASRALSPAINDPGTAIAILGWHTRLFSTWSTPLKEDNKATFDRLSLPTIASCDLFDDAFRPIARDGADNIEVMIRFQKSLHNIAQLGDEEISACAKSHANDALARAKKEMHFEGDVTALEKLSF